MKTLTRFSQLIAAVVLLFTALSLLADQPGTTPPRGHAYGYYLKDGTYVLFVYQEDGTRALSVSNARPRIQLQITCSDELRTWQTLGTMTVQGDGTASYVDATPNVPNRFYQVIPPQASALKSFTSKSR